MTISNTIAKAGPFAGNTVTTVFPFTFKVFATSDVAVVKTSATGTESTLTLDADYSVALNADQNASPGGSVTYPLSGTALATDELLTLVSAVPDLQGTDITNAGGFFPDTFEDMVDTRTIVSHQNREALDRSLKLPVSTTGVSTEITNIAAGRYLRVNNVGNGIEATEDVSTTGDYLPSGVSAISRAVNAALDEALCISVKSFGAKGDGTTDDLPAFNLAKAASVLLGKPIYAPGTTAYYKLSDEFLITASGTRLFGDGFRSCIVVHNAAGKNCITVSGATHVQIDGISVGGIAGSGHGIEFKNASHYQRVNDVTIVAVGGDGLKVTSGISGEYKGLTVDGTLTPYGTLSGGASPGVTVNGVNVPFEASGYTNNQMFTNLRLNVAATTGRSLKVGTAGQAPIGSFTLINGLIQSGEGVNGDVYLRATDAVIANTHIEMRASLWTTAYAVTMDGCQASVVSGGVIAGDVKCINGCISSGFEKVRGFGFQWDSTSVNCFGHDLIYNNNATGPTLGRLIDQSNSTEILRSYNVGGGDITATPFTQVAVGDNIGGGDVLFETLMGDWIGGASATAPSGLVLTGSPVVSRDSVTVDSGTYSALVTPAANTDGLGIALDAVALGIRGKWIVVETWVYAVGVTAVSSISFMGAVHGSTKNGGGVSHDVWERVLLSCYVAPDETTLTIVFGGNATKSFYYDRIKIRVPQYRRPLQANLPVGATPAISKHGHVAARFLLTADNTPVTNFTGPIVGEEFTIVHPATAGGNKTMTNNANIKLNGGANFDMTPGSSLTMFYRGDVAAFHELSRMTA